ncbi:hypothetical protein ABZ778_33845, partial [Streptomyces bacillaris]
QIQPVPLLLADITMVPNVIMFLPLGFLLPPSLPHWLGSADGGAVELLILFGPHGMRAHVRADPSGPDADPDPDRA